MGANDEPVPLRDSEVRSHVRLSRAPRRRRVTESLVPRAADAMDQGPVPDRVFINLENVRGTGDATAFSVYVGLGDDEDAESHPERLAGRIAPFGVSEGERPRQRGGRPGPDLVLEITDIVEELTMEGSFNIELARRLVPQRPVNEEDELTRPDQHLPAGSLRRS